MESRKVLLSSVLQKGSSETKCTMRENLKVVWIFWNLARWLHLSTISFRLGTATDVSSITTKVSISVSRFLQILLCKREPLQSTVYIKGMCESMLKCSAGAQGQHQKQLGRPSDQDSSEESLGAQSRLVIAIVFGWSCFGILTEGLPSTEKLTFSTSIIARKEWWM